jgi:hypothetical protein
MRLTQKSASTAFHNIRESAGTNKSIVGGRMCFIWVNRYISERLALRKKHYWRVKNMGKVDKVYWDKLISEIPDRNANRVRAYRAPNGEVTIHFRNFKIVLHTPQEIAEWREGFKEALHNLGDHFKNDV